MPDRPTPPPPADDGGRDRPESPETGSPAWQAELVEAIQQQATPDQLRQLVASCDALDHYSLSSTLVERSRALTALDDKAWRSLAPRLVFVYPGMSSELLLLDAKAWRDQPEAETLTASMKLGRGAVMAFETVNRLAPEGRQYRRLGRVSMSGLEDDMGDEDDDDYGIGRLRSLPPTLERWAEVYAPPDPVGPSRGRRPPGRSL